MRMRDAWRPIDEVAGTAVDTFSYCVERGDGAFYPTKVGMVFGSDSQPFTNPISWHSWHAMQSLMERDLDPLQVLIDRAHEKGMEFWADLRLGSYGGMDPNLKVDNGGRYFAEDSVRDHLAAIARELGPGLPLRRIGVGLRHRERQPSVVPETGRHREVHAGRYGMDRWSRGRGAEP